MTRWNAFSQLVLSRLREFFREPHAVFWVYGFPILLAVLLGLGFRGRKPDPPTVDVQQSPQSEKIATLLRDQGLIVEEHSAKDCKYRYIRGRTSLYLNPTESGIEVVLDPTRADSVLAEKWVEAIITRADAGDRARSFPHNILDEPGTRYIDFLLPGLVGINLMGGGLFGIGFVLVDMRVRKLFKRLMATPVNRGDFLLALFTARLIFLAPEMLSLLVLARWLFGVPNFGSWGTLTLVVLCGSMAFAGIGFLIGARVEKTETASGIMNAIMLPMYILSGVFFAAKGFPDWMQPLIQALPLTQLIDALREVMLGAGLMDVAGRLLILTSWAGGCFFLARRWFKWT